MTMHNLRLPNQTKQTDALHTNNAAANDRYELLQADQVFRSAPQQPKPAANPASKKAIVLWYGVLAIAFLFITYRIHELTAIYH